MGTRWGRGIVGLLGVALALPGAALPRAEAQAAGGELVVITTVLPLLDEAGPDAYGRAVDINNRGVVVGSSGRWPTMWRRGEVVPLTDEAPADGGWGQAVNERGEVIVVRVGQPLTRWFRGRSTELDLGPESRLWELAGFNDRGQALLRRWVTRGAEIGIWEPDGSFTPITAPEGRPIEPVALSEGGHVIGNLLPFGGFDSRPFVWKDGELTVLAEGGFARGVNRRGQVAGGVLDLDDPARWPMGRATVWDRGEEIAVVPDEVRYSSVEDINDRGQVIGVWAAGAENGHAYLWDDGEMTEIVESNGRPVAPAQLNERGQVVGYYSVDTFNFRAFFWDRGDMVELGPGIAPDDLNDRGQALGRMVDPQGGQERPVIWTVRHRR
jgi:probable HAF family extracellular repeat protein